MQNEGVEQVLNLFRQFNYSKNSVLYYLELSSLLKSVSKSKTEKEFPKALLDELWGQAETRSKGETTVLIISQIIVEAYNILTERIQLIEQSLPTKIKQL